MLSTFNEIDMTNLFELRQKVNKSLETSNQKIGLMPFFVSATTKSLEEQKIINSFIDGPDIVQNNQIDISIAVASKKGLFVPVLRDTSGISLMGVEKMINNFKEKAEKGTITPSDMAGGTFTITNGGIFGSLLSTPIINPPQSAILGLHTIQDRPMVVDKQILVI